MCEALNILSGYDLAAMGFLRRTRCMSSPRRCGVFTSIATTSSAIQSPVSYAQRLESDPTGFRIYASDQERP
jgi:hypothetical protein